MTAEPRQRGCSTPLWALRPDAVEAYPEPIILPREQGDEEQAEMLSRFCP